MEKTEFSIVIPIYNEEGNIPELYRRLEVSVDYISADSAITFTSGYNAC